jgi:preprotein translocase subunit SecB
MSDEATPPPQGPPGAAAQFNIRKLYVKDLSFESPRAPGVFADAQAGPQLDLQLGTQANALGGDDWEVVLMVHVTARRGEETLFLIELQQAGVFQIRGIPQDQMPLVLGVACPNVLFPYARQAISDATLAGGFPPVVLAPVNFEALARAQREDGAAATH